LGRSGAKPSTEYSFHSHSKENEKTIICCLLFSGGSFVGIAVFIVGEENDGLGKFLKQAKNQTELYFCS
jgi:hypothetical protein